MGCNTSSDAKTEEKSQQQNKLNNTAGEFSYKTTTTMEYTTSNYRCI